MAKIIEFHIPKDFQKNPASACSERGKLIEFPYRVALDELNQGATVSAETALAAKAVTH